MMKHSSGHEFALYMQGIKHMQGHQACVITDKEAVHRIIHVLRCQPGHVLTFFDEHVHARMTLVAVLKKGLEFQAGAVVANRLLVPHITVWLPILKKDAFEQALYSLVELGVNVIQPVYTQKTHKYTWFGLSRMRKIMIAAAEQSKHFAMADLKEPVAYAQVLQRYDYQGPCIFFDVEGKPLFETIVDARKHGVQRYTLFVGPEADLTAQEKQGLYDHGWTVTRLTPTVLRAKQAITVGVGAFRSMLA